MATDIAFALGVLAVLGSRVPPPLKVFLLTLAIADDLGAIAVIAIFYSADLQPRYLLVGAALAIAVAVMRRLNVTYPPLYVVAGIALWVAVFESGIHATIAGVMMGLLTPARPLQTDFQAEAVIDALENRVQLTTEDIRDTASAIRDSVSVCDRLLELLHPWTSYLIVPVFALANAGISLDANPLDHGSVFIGVVLGLVVGKVLGIAGFAWLAIRARIATLPAGVSWAPFIATAALGGIGFTVSLFITGLAYTDDGPAASAKAGILLASILAALIGAAIFLVSHRRTTADVRLGSDAPG